MIQAKGWDLGGQHGWHELILWIFVKGSSGRFAVSQSCAIKLMQRWKDTGSVIASSSSPSGASPLMVMTVSCAAPAEGGVPSGPLLSDPTAPSPTIVAGDSSSGR